MTLHNKIMPINYVLFSVETSFIKFKCMA